MTEDQRQMRDDAIYEEERERRAGITDIVLGMWTISGKHPKDMDAKELGKELDVFDEIRLRGDFLSPEELAREDTLVDYLQEYLTKHGE